MRFFNRRGILVSVCTILFITSVFGVTSITYMQNTAMAQSAGSVTADIKYVNGGTESDTANVTPGQNLTVRLYYNNQGNAPVTATSLKSAIPTGFGIVANSLKNCLVPSAGELECSANFSTTSSTLNANNLSLSPLVGLYDAASASAQGGTATNAASGLLEIGKKRFIYLTQCQYNNDSVDGELDYDSFMSFINTTSNVGFRSTSTGAGNAGNLSVGCETGSGVMTSVNVPVAPGWNYLPPNISNTSIENIDTRNRRFLHINQCSYNYETVRSPIDFDSWTGFTTTNSNPGYRSLGTGSSNQGNRVSNCQAGVSPSYPGNAWALNPVNSGIQNLDLLGNRYLHLNQCSYNITNLNGSNFDSFTTLIQTQNNGFRSLATTTNNSSTQAANCEPGITGQWEYIALNSGIQTIDLLDNTRGRGYIEMMLTAPTTTGSFNQTFSIENTSVLASDSGSITVTSTATTPLSEQEIRSLPITCSVLGTAYNFGSLEVYAQSTTSTVIANSLATCTFTIPQNRRLPDGGLFLGIGNGLVSGQCQISSTNAGLVICSNVPTGSLTGIQPIRARIGTNGNIFDTNSRVNVNSSGTTVRTGGLTILTLLALGSGLTIIATLLIAKKRVGSVEM